MRKFGLIAIGLVIAGGASGMFGYRWFIEPQPRGVLFGHKPALQQAQGSSDPRTRSIGVPAPRRQSDGQGAALSTPQPGASTAAKGAVTPNASAPGGWHLFETALNIANVVVGILGIWMTIVGIRMQQIAFAVQRNR